MLEQHKVIPFATCRRQEASRQTDVAWLDTPQRRKHVQRGAASFARSRVVIVVEHIHMTIRHRGKIVIRGKSLPLQVRNIPVACYPITGFDTRMGVPPPSLSRAAFSLSQSLSHCLSPS
jgi:hypothetical protein